MHNSGWRPYPAAALIVLILVVASCELYEPERLNPLHGALPAVSVTGEVVGQDRDKPWAPAESEFEFGLFLSVVFDEAIHTGIDHIAITNLSDAGIDSSEVIRVLKDGEPLEFNSGKVFDALDTTTVELSERIDASGGDCRVVIDLHVWRTAISDTSARLDLIVDDLSTVTVGGIAVDDGDADGLLGRDNLILTVTRRAGIELGYEISPDFYPGTPDSAVVRLWTSGESVGPFEATLDMSSLGGGRRLRLGRWVDGELVRGITVDEEVPVSTSMNIPIIVWDSGRKTCSVETLSTMGLPVVCALTIDSTHMCLDTPRLTYSARNLPVLSLKICNEQAEDIDLLGLVLEDTLNEFRGVISGSVWLDEHRDCSIENGVDTCLGRSDIHTGSEANLRIDGFKVSAGDSVYVVVAYDFSGPRRGYPYRCSVTGAVHEGCRTKRQCSTSCYLTGPEFFMTVGRGPGQSENCHEHGGSI